MVGMAAEQREVARGQRQHVLHQRAGKAEPPVIAQLRAGPGHDLDARARRVGEADDFQRVEGRGVDPQDVGLLQRAVLPALHARPHGPGRAELRRRARRDLRRPATGPARPPGPLRRFRRVIHVRTLSALGSYIGARLANAACLRPATSISNVEARTSAALSPAQGT